MTTGTIHQQGRYLLVPVLDEDTGNVICWDAHLDTIDWASGEPVATGQTLAACRTDLSEWIAYDRTMRRFTGRA